MSQKEEGKKGVTGARPPPKNRRCPSQGGAHNSRAGKIPGSGFHAFHAFQGCSSHYQGSMLTSTSTGAASGWKSTDIITLRQVMVTMENMNSLRAQRESSTAAL